MVEYGKDTFEGDYVRLATLNEYEEIFGTTPGATDRKILTKYGGHAYKIIMVKYNGKLVLTGGDDPEQLETYAFPPKILFPWHEEKENGEISTNEFESIIGVQL